MRDGGIGVAGHANGFVVNHRDGSPSSVMRLGTREGLRIGIRAYLDRVAVTTEPRGPLGLPAPTPTGRPAFPEGRWNGEPALCEHVIVTVADDGRFPYYWAKELVGQRRAAVRVTYGGQVAYLDNADGRAVRKVQAGGLPSMGHRDLVIGAVVQELGPLCPHWPDALHRNTESLVPASQTRCKCGWASVWNLDWVGDGS